MTGRGAEAHGDLLAGKWHSMWWFDWSPTRKLRERFHVCLVYMRVFKISLKLLKLLEHSVHIQSPEPQEERKWQTPPRPCIFQWANTSQQVMPLNIFPYWHGFCCVATQKRDWGNKICVLVFIFLWHVSGWIAILFNFVPANGRSLQMQSRHSFCASPLWLFVVGSRSWGETRTRAIEMQKDEKSKNGHLFYYNKGVYFWNLDTRCTGEAPNVRC